MKLRMLVIIVFTSADCITDVIAGAVSSIDEANVSCFVSFFLCGRGGVCEAEETFEDEAFSTFRDGIGDSLMILANSNRR